jgi:hypothetical protein
VIRCSTMLRRPRPCVSVGAFAQVLSGFVLVSHIAQVAVDTITLSLPPCIHTIILPLSVILDPRPIVYHAHSLLQISISLLGIFCNGDIKFCSLIQLTMLQLTLSSCFFVCFDVKCTLCLDCLDREEMFRLPSPTQQINVSVRLEHEAT